MNIYLYYLNLEKPSNLIKLYERKKTANKFFKIEQLTLSENLNDK